MTGRGLVVLDIAIIALLLLLPLSGLPGLGLMVLYAFACWLDGVRPWAPWKQLLELAGAGGLREDQLTP